MKAKKTRQLTQPIRILTRSSTAVPKYNSAEKQNVVQQCGKNF